MNDCVTFPLCNWTAAYEENKTDFLIWNMNGSRTCGDSEGILSEIWSENKSIFVCVLEMGCESMKVSDS